MNIDAIFVISLSTDIDRQHKFLNNWKGLDIQLFIVERNKDPKKGCFESHMDIIRMAKEKSLKRILILEDDAIPTKPIRDIIEYTNMAIKWMDNNDDKWKYYLLGYFPVKSKRTENSFILNLKCAFLSHAYIANVPNLEVSKWNGVQVDNVMFCNITNNIQMIGRINNFKSYKSHIYGARPMLAIQDNGPSTINQAHVAIQDLFLHQVGQDKLSDMSCYVNIISLLVIFFLLFIFTPILIILGVYKNKHPIAFISFLIFYILFIIASLIALLI